MELKKHYKNEYYYFSITDNITFVSVVYIENDYLIFSKSKKIRFKLKDDEIKVLKPAYVTDKQSFKKFVNSRKVNKIITKYFKKII